MHSALTIHVLAKDELPCWPNLMNKAYFQESIEDSVDCDLINRTDRTIGADELKDFRRACRALLIGKNLPHRQARFGHSRAGFFELSFALFDGHGFLKRLPNIAETYGYCK